MKRIKKILALLCAMLLLTACGGQTAPVSPDEAQDAAQTETPDEADRDAPLADEGEDPPPSLQTETESPASEDGSSGQDSTPPSGSGSSDSSGGSSGSSGSSSGTSGGSSGTNIVDSGLLFSSSVQWELDSDGTLTLRGFNAYCSDYAFTTWYNWPSKFPSIRQVVYLPGVMNTGNEMFSGVYIIESVDLGTVQTINSGSFEDTKLRSLSIPSTVSIIGSEAFKDCTALPSVYIGGHVKEIGDFAFLNCNSMTSLTLEEGISSIGNYAFSECSSLESVYIPSSIGTINIGLFSYCSSLANVTIGAGITKVDFEAFRECSSLASVTFTGDAPFLDSGCFSGTTATIYYPAGNKTWTEEITSYDYGGSLTWVPVG